MKKFRRWFIVTLFVLLGMEILTIAPKRLGKKEEVKKDKKEKSTSSIATTSQVMRGVHLVEGSAGGRVWELEADYAQGYKEKGAWKLDGVLSTYYGTNGLSYKVTGETGSYEFESKNMEIMGNVVVQTSDGFVIKCESLKFNNLSRELRTEDVIHITGPKKDGLFELTAKGFVTDMKTNIMNLKENVKAVRSVGTGELKKDMNIKSARATIHGSNNKAHFEKDVQVDIESVRMTGNAADFQYDQKNHVLNSLLMVGDVRVTDTQHFASSERALVLFEKNEFILSGNPRVIQNDNELRGEEIHLIDGGKQVKVLRARARVENQNGEI
jgi:LPS export ABC transporter protein LptC